MIGIVLISHGRLADEMLLAMEHIMGPQKDIETVCILSDENIEGKRDELFQKVKSVNSGSGVAILTDMFGGTPSNLAISLMNEPKVDVLAGLNLPMLIKLVKVREKPLDMALTDAMLSGQKYITKASDLLK